MGEIDISIGMSFSNGLCGSVGDTLCISAILERLSEEKGTKLIMCARPELHGLWLNNPYIKIINTDVHPMINMIPCRQVPCNIVNYFASQLNFKFSKPLMPRIYLTPEEIEWGKNQLIEFNGHKKIVICGETGFDSKNLRPDYIAPMFNKLKENGYKLIRVGVGRRDSYQGYDKSFYNMTTLRQAFTIMNDCDLFVGIDCGLFHAAAALDIPQVIFFRNNLSSNNKYPDTYYIDSGVVCQGACLNHIGICQGHPRCMDSFNLDEYFDLIEEQLNK